MIGLRSTALATTFILILAGSASADMVPTVMITPGPNKPVEVFRQDRDQCRDYADHVAAGDANAAGDVLGGAFVGGVLGALLGSAADGRHGAGIGALGGAMAGAAVGASAADRDQARLQHLYDDAYERCMYAHDDLLPGEESDDAPPPPPPNPR